MSIKVFQITGIRGQELLDLRGKIAALAGQFCPVSGGIGGAECES